jgi:rhodanese-related sulfurtransferase
MQDFNLESVINQATLLPKYDDKSSNYFLLDVRTSYEFSDHHIPGSVNIPIDDLLSRLHEIPAKKHIITICDHGIRSGHAETILRENKFQCDSLEGGLMNWTGQMEKGK